MNPSLAALEEEIRQCRQLAALYQEERDRYLAGEDLTLAMAATFQKRKLELTAIFDRRCDWLAAFAGGDVRRPGHESLKKACRQLASLLEQLLVIDRENEVLLRQRLQTPRPAYRRPAPAGAEPARVTRPGPRQGGAVVVPAVFPRLKAARIGSCYGLAAPAEGAADGLRRGA